MPTRMASSPHKGRLGSYIVQLYLASILLLSDISCRPDYGVSVSPLSRSARSIVAEVFKPQAYSNLMYSQRYMSPSEYKPLHGRATVAVDNNLRVCTTWGASSYRTFDNLLYSFEGTCAYTLMHDFSADGFRISVINNPDCYPKFKPGGCIRQVIITPESGASYRLVYDDNSTEPQVYKGNERLEVPSTDGLLVFSRVTHWLVITSSQGYILKFDGIQTVTIHIDSKWKNLVRGLCGTFDDDPNNDLTSPDGNVYSVSNVEQFAGSWEHTDLVPAGQSCLTTAIARNFSATATDAERENARVSCEKILSNDCKPYVDQWEWYFTWCKNEYLGCEGGGTCNCDTLAEFHRQCFRKGRQPFDWGGPQSCSAHSKCSVDKSYNECGSLCLKTCTNREQTTCPGDHCVEGCLCPPGNVLDANSLCIPEAMCPCEYQGLEYVDGDSVSMGCESCTCAKGFWECHGNQCGARCSQITDVHYKTFDGKMFDFTGECFYTMLKNDDLFIAMEKSGCSTTFSHAGIAVDPFTGKSYCKKKIYLVVPNADGVVDTLMLYSNKEVLINSNMVMSMPYRFRDIIVDEDYKYIEVYITSLKVRILWDGDNHMFIDIPDAFINKTLGLCGTYTKSQDDDFLTESGDIEADAYNFANKWRVPPGDGQCDAVRKIDSHPCAINTEMKMEDARKECDKLKNMDVFKVCHSSVDPGPYIDACLYDICSCRTDKSECLCSIFSAYVIDCNRADVLIEWRNEMDVCGVHCPGDQMWTTCANPCQDTCMTIAGFHECEPRCYEGCSCPKGETLDAIGKCIPVSKCPCIQDNKEYESGYRQLRGMKYCECKDARWDCHIASNEELNELVAIEMCPANDNKEDTDCRTKCPETCANKDVSGPTCIESVGVQTDMCIAGCKCKLGYIYDQSSNRCVFPFDCPCFHGGKRYGSGDSLQQDCKKCTCNGGTWQCENKECPAECSAWGLEHYSTFDGKEFDFIGDCAYTLAKGAIDDYEKFEVTIENYPCSTTGRTCTKYISVKTGGGEVIFRQNNAIPKTLQYGVPLVVRDIGLYVFVKTDIGVSVLWDKGSRVYVRLMPKWKNTTVQGLCGNYDGDQSNDFMGPMGGFSLPQASKFADEWKTFPYCPNAKEYSGACADKPQRREWALQACSALYSNTFSACHGEVDPVPFYSRCVSDSCACDTGGDCGCLCSALAAYAQQCNRKGVPLKWRSQSLCPIQCRTCDVYSPCKPVEPPLTCETKIAYPELVFGCGDEPCVEGCIPPECPDGKIYLDETSLECIPEPECPEIPCTMWNGTIIKEGDPVPNYASDCEQCFCTKGNITCTGMPCTTTTEQPTSPLPSTTPRCPNEQEYSGCAFFCNQTCDSLLQDLISAKRCGHKDDCIPGCKTKTCELPKVWLDIDTCIDLKDCPCKMENGSYVAPNRVVLEERCKKCQCTNNTYDCWVPTECITTTPPPPCSDVMGAENRDLADYQYSSPNNKPGFPPSNGRLNNAEGAYIGDPTMSKPAAIIIDFLEPRNLSGILLQGYNGSYPKKFRVEIGNSLDDMKPITIGGTSFVSNEPGDSEEITRNIFDKVIEGRFIKVTIISYHNSPAMRLEPMGCYHVYPTTPPPPAPPCPELTALMKENCTFPCNVNQMCDGVKCVVSKDCPCVQENKKYATGKMVEKTNCDKCICQAGGISKCEPLNCTACPRGMERNLTEACSCNCNCKDNYRLCPTDKICIPDPEWCDGIQTCTDDETGCPPPDKCEYIGDNCATFDSVDYDCKMCNAVLMHDKLTGLFSVDIHRECNTNDTNMCTKYLVIKHSDKSFKFNDDLSVEHNGYTYKGKLQIEGLANSNPGFQLIYEENVDLKFKSLLYNFTATWTTQKSVKIEIRSELYKKVDGLCGFYDGNKTGDLMLPSGMIAENGTSMVDAWELSGDAALETCVKSNCSNEMQVKATSMCTAIMAEPFHLCTKLVNLRNFYQACMSVLCDCSTSAVNRTLEECLCDALIPLAKDCQEARTGTPLPGWREKYGCIPKCDNTDMTWQECGPLCETTCKNYEGTPECATECTPGCYCPAGLILNIAGDKCVKPKECKDCLCSGYGDPHYTTFDGLKYTAVMNCDVFLASHKDMEFDIRGYHGQCGNESRMTCLNSIKIDMDHIAYSIIIDPDSLTIGTNSLTMADMPFEDDQVRVEGTIGGTLTVFCEQKELEVTYFAKNHGFRVVFPSKIYYNDVAGTCGRCNHDISDERWMQTTGISNNTAEFLSSWHVGTGDCEVKPYDSNQMDLSSIPDTVCHKFMSDTFKQCNPMVDPEPYVDECKRDYLLAYDKTKSICKSMMAYARQCCHEGIALNNWTTEAGCPQDCPNGMEFQVCRKPCTKTCDNFKTFNLENCPMLPVDGCFCPEQKALMNGQCKDADKCEFCDDEGHKVGDVWEKGPCTTCSCNCSTFVECVKIECPPEITCSSEENKVEIPMTPADCCQTHRCVPKCAEANIPVCDSGEKLKTNADSKNCSYYVCECDPTACPVLTVPDLDVGETYKTVKVGCCYKYEKYCNASLCPDELKCAPPFTYNETAGVCCPTMSCVPPEIRKCEYTDLQNNVTNYEFGETWTDGPCINCTCKNESYNFVTECVEQKCQDIASLPDAKDFALEPIVDGVICCPAVKRTSCKINNATIEHGGKMSDPNDTCVTYSCAKNNEGQLEKKTLVTKCNVKCLPFEKYLDPEEGVCCGGCKPDKCIHEKNERQFNETWINEANKCENATCILNEFMSEVILEPRYKCPPVDTNCPKEHVIKDDDYEGCCSKCAVEPECTLIKLPENETLNMLVVTENNVNCTNKESIPGLTFCRGNCGNHCFSSGNFDPECACCEVKEYKDLEVSLSCTDGSTSNTTIRKATECYCLLNN